MKSKLIPNLSKICKWLKINKANRNAIKAGFVITGSGQNVLIIDVLPVIKIDGSL